MKKIISLILIAAAVIGAVIGLMYIIAPAGEEDDVQDFSSEQANEWKAQIDELCQDGNWTEAGYNKIESGIHTDCVASKGELLTNGEESALQKYLFATSCAYLYKQVDELFKEADYPAKTVSASDEMLAFLTDKIDTFGANSNLTDASSILAEYHQLPGLLSFSSAARYSRPLRAYSAISAEAARNRINAMKYYNSHFSKNPSIRSKVAGLASNRAAAESDYYMNLERAVENHYRSTHDDVELLEDQMRFNQISTNSSARSRLSHFVDHPSK